MKCRVFEDEAVDLSSRFILDLGGLQQLSTVRHLGANLNLTGKP